jgi:transposase-like protein
MMAMNRIQFQPGLSLAEFQHAYGTEAQCELAVERARWPDGFICRCGHAGHGVVWHGRVKTFQCHQCRRQTTLTSGTIFEATKLPLRLWFLAMYWLTQTKNNVAALELRRVLGVCYRTAWRLKHKLLQVMVEAEADRRLGVRVEIDDAYLGGERTGGKRGRGSENKVPFVAAVETTVDGRPLWLVVSRVSAFSGAEIEAWAKRHLAASTVVVSDGLACFKAVEKAECVHDENIVGNGRKSVEMPCFTWVNTVLGNLKTALSGTYHAFDFDKYGTRYLAEAQYRFNRRFDLKAIFPATVLAAVATGPRPERWLRLDEARR